MYGWSYQQILANFRLQPMLSASEFCYFTCLTCVKTLPNMWRMFPFLDSLNFKWNTKTELKITVCVYSRAQSRFSIDVTKDSLENFIDSQTSNAHIHSQFMSKFYCWYMSTNGNKVSSSLRINEVLTHAPILDSYLAEQWWSIVIFIIYISMVTGVLKIEIWVSTKSTKLFEIVNKTWGVERRKRKSLFWEKYIWSFSIRRRWQTLFFMGRKGKEV